MALGSLRRPFPMAPVLRRLLEFTMTRCTVWRELIGSVGPDVTFHGSESEETIAALEQSLSCRLPPDLGEVLSEVGGVSCRGVPVLWTAEEVLRENRALRDDPDFADLYMPFDPLLFFGGGGGGGGGDLFAFIRNPERDRDIFLWEHESDSRYRVAFSLRDYLRQAISGAGGDWFRGNPV
ncbi:SMI1/KNR4 family protein [Streptomyces sp. NPDC000229]|uniref:SMI1/KNR4 family protein n=1 Tax=Streptomyces sp. NPDC000229 TaxID=3154247 RepID=UPI003328E13E